MRIPRSAHYDGVFDRARMMREAGAEPLEAFPGYGKRWRCRCLRCDEEITPSYNSVQQGRDPCRYCARRAQPPKPQRAIKQDRGPAEVAGTGPVESSQLSHREANTRVSRAGEEPANRFRGVWSEDSTQTQREKGGFDPVRVMREAGADPLEGYPGSLRPWRCRCLRCDEEITPTYSNVQQGKNPCRQCAYDGSRTRHETSESGVLASEDFRDRLLTELKASGLEVLTDVRGFRDQLTAKCLQCGQKSDAKTFELIKDSHVCGGKRFLRRADKWTEDRARMLLRVVGHCTPLEPYPGYKNGWKVQCSRCGSTSVPTLNNLVSGQGPCRRCGQVKNVLDDDSGDRSYFIYILHNAKIGATKVGIANEYGSRFRAQTGAWKKVLVLRCSTAQEAVDAETAVLRLWRLELKLEPAVQRHSMKGKGYTETAPETGLKPAITLLRQMQANGGWEDVTPSRTGSDKGDR